MHSMDTGLALSMHSMDFMDAMRLAPSMPCMHSMDTSLALSMHSMDSMHRAIASVGHGQSRNPSPAAAPARAAS